MDTKEECKELHQALFKRSPRFGFVHCPECDWFPYGYNTMFGVQNWPIWSEDEESIEKLGNS